MQGATSSSETPPNRTRCLSTLALATKRGVSFGGGRPTSSSGRAAADNVIFPMHVLLAVCVLCVPGNFIACLEWARSNGDNFDGDKSARYYTKVHFWKGHVIVYRLFRPPSERAIDFQKKNSMCPTQEDIQVSGDGKREV